MVGIYKITNLLTGENYISQSKDVEQRCKEHLYHKVSNVDKALWEYGRENFLFTPLFECKPEDLDRFEEYFIQLYKSNEPGYGYNLLPGGQHCKGESNPKAKLTAEDVYNIREAYNNRIDQHLVYQQYMDKVSPSYFLNLWEGTAWPEVHYDVYTPENKKYYADFGGGNRQDVYQFTDKEVMYYRSLYVDKTASEIYKIAGHFEMPFSTFKSMLNGHSYKHLPYYDKKNKEWVNN